jgi:1-phosphofructokinase family hexose kinase
LAIENNNPGEIMIYTLTLNPALDRELLVPEITYGNVIRTSEINIDIGGKGFNVSRMLSIMGINNVAVGFLGKKTGEIMADGLEALKIKADIIWINEETRTNISIVSKLNNQHIKVNENGPFVSLVEQNKLLQHLENTVQPDDWFVLAGSLPRNIHSDYYARIINIAQSHNAKVILDTSGEALELSLSEKPYLIKPNHKEACEISGLPGNTIDEIKTVASFLRKKGAQNVVISLGDKGAFLQTDEGSWVITSPKIIEKNPIGAGDSLVGGILYGISNNLNLQEALKWGVACGAITASLHGTQMGSIEMITSLHSLVNIEKV